MNAIGKGQLSMKRILKRSISAVVPASWENSWASQCNYICFSARICRRQEEIRVTEQAVSVHPQKTQGRSKKRISPQSLSERCLVVVEFLWGES